MNVNNISPIMLAILPWALHAAAPIHLPATSPTKTAVATPIEVILWDVGGVINEGDAFWKIIDDLAAKYHVPKEKIIAYTDPNRKLVDLGQLSEYAFWHNALVFAGVNEATLAAAPRIGTTHPYAVPSPLQNNPEAIAAFVELNGQRVYADIFPYIQPIQGTIDVMKDIQATGQVRQGILSNDSKALGGMKKWKLYSTYVDGKLFVISADLGVKKPDPAIYQEALRRSGMTDHPE